MTGARSVAEARNWLRSGTLQCHLLRIEHETSTMGHDVPMAPDGHDIDMSDPDCTGDFVVPTPESATWSQLMGITPDAEEVPHWIRLPVRQNFSETLWHYTNIAGALGIIQSGTLRATALPFLNDTSEFQRGLKVLDITNKALQDSAHIHPVQKHVVGRAVEAAHHPSLQADLYAACASEVEDSLSQWRAYGGEGGVALGLDPTSCLPLLVDRGAETHPAVPLRADRPSYVSGWKKVAYGDEASYEHLLEVLGHICHVCPTPDSTDDQLSVFVDDVATPALMEAIALCKDSAFAEEREVRAVVRKPIETAASFRPGAYGPTPFLDLTFAAAQYNTEITLPPWVTEANPFPLAAARVGPGPHAKTVALGLELLLSTVGSDTADLVMFSGAPFR